MGNAQLDTTFILKNLPQGTYYWSVQAIDNCFKGGAFSEEGFFTVGTVGVTAVANNNILLYPNPAKNTLILQNLKGKATINIYNLQGQLIQQTHLAEGKNQVDVSGLKYGMHILKIATNHKTFNQTFIKK